MAESTAIEWARSTFNPWIGCQKIGPGCDRCYAEAANVRFAAGRNWGPGAPRRRTSAEYWKQLGKWNMKAAASGERWTVFGGSQCDPFDNAVDPQWRADYWREIRDTPALTYILVTKRVGNAPDMLPPDWGEGYPNVWLLITVVNQAEADRDIPKLLETPAAKRGLSIEPMLGPINLRPIRVKDYRNKIDRPASVYPLDGSYQIPDCHYSEPSPRIDWVIAGGESGPGARPSHPDWFRSLRDQCAVADVPYFFKQWGEWIDDGSAIRIIGIPDERTAERWDERAQRLGDVMMVRLGKKTTGATLDGREHREFPA